MTAIRLMIVDDKAQVRRELRSILPLAGRQAGLSLEIIGEAENGQEAILKASELQPDVILMDLEMPVLDGCAATRTIKSRLPSANVIALTIHASPIDREMAGLAGVDRFIEKGVPVAEIIRSIVSLVIRKEKHYDYPFDYPPKKI
jgi:DNA-binding NarL/FixJ family response regulator